MNTILDKRIIALTSKSGTLLNSSLKSNVFFQFTNLFNKDPSVAYAEVGVVSADTEDLINLTLAVKGTEAAAILIEQPDGRIKVSFRSRGPVDCSTLAGRFGGGGHKAAAGAILDGPFEAAHDRVTAALDEAWEARMG